MSTRKKNVVDVARRILLATELGCRSDRAFERAVQLAQQWNATLFALYVAPQADAAHTAPSWRRGATVAQTVEHQLRADLGDRRVDLQVVVDHGEPYKAVLQRAREFDCELIVVGLNRESLLGSHKLGGTIEKLVQHADRPVLMVKQRAHGAYGASIVASDFSPCARRALECATRLFPMGDVAVLHGYRVPFEHFGKPEANAGAAQTLAVSELQRFIAAADLAPKVRGRLRSLVEYGAPTDVLGAYLRERPHDLVVVGARGDSGVLDRLLGSTAIAITAGVNNDVLIVRSPADQAQQHAA
ncbi:universal stress protein [Solimonas soli]|uniref:universal stress protein n=1 Tax=Solimonas soli TaxID=413479 RepID=UPI0004AFB94B|nr:universal stress protein [Solimonas soli]